MPPPRTPVFTDDRTPVEAMTRRMLASLSERREVVTSNYATMTLSIGV